jgi:hypothetical protein
MKLGRALVAVGTVGHAGAYLWAAPAHIIDRFWPGHARFHVLQALLWAIGFDAVVLALALGPPSPRVWWLLLVSGLFVHGSYFVALAVFPSFGPPELSAHLILGAFMAIYFAGLVSMRRLRA